MQLFSTQHWTKISAALLILVFIAFQNCAKAPLSQSSSGAPTPGTPLALAQENMTIVRQPRNVSLSLNQCTFISLDVTVPDGATTSYEWTIKGQVIRNNSQTIKFCAYETSPGGNDVMTFRMAAQENDTFSLRVVVSSELEGETQTAESADIAISVLAKQTGTGADTNRYSDPLLNYASTMQVALREKQQAEGDDPIVVIPGSNTDFIGDATRVIEVTTGNFQVNLFDAAGKSFVFKTTKRFRIRPRLARYAGKTLHDLIMEITALSLPPSGEYRVMFLWQANAAFNIRIRVKGASGAVCEGNNKSYFATDAGGAYDVTNIKIDDDGFRGLARVKMNIMLNAAGLTGANYLDIYAIQTRYDQVHGADDNGLSGCVGSSWPD
mgnify:CR=1 FL=1